MANKTAPMRRQSSFSVFMHNKESGTYLGKSPEHWRKLLFFYFCYYSMCTALFAIVYSVMISTIPDRADGPKIQIHLERPFLNVAPKGLDYSLTDPTSFEDEIEAIDNLFFNFPVTDVPGAADFPAECTASPYGYPDNPCVFLRLNRIFDYRIPIGRGNVDVTAKQGSPAPAFTVNPAIFPLAPPNVYMGQMDYRDPMVAIQFPAIAPTGDVGTLFVQVDCDPVDAGNADEGCFNEIDVFVAA